MIMTDRETILPTNCNEKVFFPSAVGQNIICLGQAGKNIIRPQKSFSPPPPSLQCRSLNQLRPARLEQYRKPK